MKSSYISLFAFLLWLSTSAGAQPTDNETMLVKASALTKVAAAVESAVRFRGAPDNLSEAELLRFATSHDPEMLDAFRGYALRVRRQGRNTSVLLCTEDGGTALIEDSGCTARLDAHLWERMPPLRCEFQLRLEEICPTTQ